MKKNIALYAAICILLTISSTNVCSELPDELPSIISSGSNSQNSSRESSAERKRASTLAHQMTDEQNNESKPLRSRSSSQSPLHSSAETPPGSPRILATDESALSDAAQKKAEERRGRIRKHCGHLDQQLNNTSENVGVYAAAGIQYLNDNLSNHPSRSQSPDRARSTSAGPHTDLSTSQPPFEPAQPEDIQQNLSNHPSRSQSRDRTRSTNTGPHTDLGTPQLPFEPAQPENITVQIIGADGNLLETDPCPPSTQEDVASPKPSRKSSSDKALKKFLTTQSPEELLAATNAMLASELLTQNSPKNQQPAQKEKEKDEKTFFQRHPLFMGITVALGLTAIIALIFYIKRHSADSLDTSTAHR